MQMFVHAEESLNNPVADGEVSAFIRFGTDLTSNYYEYEIPLKLTRGYINMNSANADKSIWPDENFIDIPFDSLYNLKIVRWNRELKQPLTYMT